MAKLIRYLTLPAPKRRRTENGNRNNGFRTPQLPSGYYLDNLCRSPDHALSRDSMRLVLLAESEQHRAIFDSSCIIPVSDGLIPHARQDPEGMFQYLPRAKDTGELGQMLFGTMAAANGTASVKIHSLGGNRILISRVFTINSGTTTNRRTRNEQSESAASSCESECAFPMTVHSLDGLAHSFRKANSTCSPPEKFVPLRSRRSRQSSLQMSPDDDEVRSNRSGGAASTDWDELRALSPPHRVFSRTRRNEALTRMSLQDDGCSLRSMNEQFSSMSADTEVRTVGLGVILDGEERPFLMQHMPLIEGELCRLEKRIQLAAVNRATFLKNIYEGWQSFSSGVCTLYNTPRLRDPVWLRLARRSSSSSSSGSSDAAFASRFCSILAELTHRCDTKHEKFFLSNLISAVLMHHMSWIASVAPPPTSVSTCSSATPSTLASPTRGTDSQSALHGFNPHLAQLLEISGCVGGASRSARTVVCGSDGELIVRLLHVLSYFIRCTTIELRTESSFSPSSEFPDSLNDFLLGSPEDDGRGPSSMSESSHSSLDSSPGIFTCEVAGPSRPSRLDRIPSMSISQQAGLGESLLAGPTPTYSPYFVLSGLLTKADSNEDYITKITDELLGYGDSTVASIRAQMYPGPTPENVTIVADCATWSVRVVSGDSVADMASPADTVLSMLEQFSELHREGLNPNVLTDVMEDALADILAKSISLVELVEGGLGASRSISSDRALKVVGCEYSDLRLLTNVAAVYCPEILTAIEEREQKKQSAQPTSVMEIDFGE